MKSGDILSLTPDELGMPHTAPSFGTAREFESDGYRVVTRTAFESDIASLSNLDPKVRTIALFPRRAVLRVGVLYGTVAPSPAGSLSAKPRSSILANISTRLSGGNADSQCSVPVLGEFRAFWVLTVTPGGRNCSRTPAARFGAEPSPCRRTARR